MKALIIGTLFLFSGIVSLAQQPKKVTEKFFPEIDIAINTPTFQKNKGTTSYDEMMEYIEKIRAQAPELITVEMVGKSQKGEEIPLVKVSSGEGDKLRMLYTGRIHGDEPAGTEALLYFLDQLVTVDSLKQYLTKIDFYLMPMINIDGGENNTRQTANGTDLNRDMSKLDTPEAIAFHQAANKILPDVYMDMHEYQPIRADFNEIADGRVISNPYDVMFLYSSNPNVPKVLRDAVDNIYLPAEEAVLDANQLTHHQYYTTRKEKGELLFAVGGSSPRSSSNAMALKNSISILLETRGIKLDRVSLKRRIYTMYLLAVEHARQTYENSEKVKEIIAEAQNDRSDIAVKFAGEKVKEYDLQFIDLIKNELITIPVTVRFANKQNVTLSRKRPAAYYLLPTEEKAIDRLSMMGVQVMPITSDTTLMVESYKIVTFKENEDGEVSVSTEVKEQEVTLPKGTMRVDMSQRLSNVAAVLLEPESANGFVNYKVIKTEKGVELPIYREKIK